MRKPDHVPPEAPPAAPGIENTGNGPEAWLRAIAPGPRPEPTTDNRSTTQSWHDMVAQTAGAQQTVI